jgi:hypothetical protein
MPGAFTGTASSTNSQMEKMLRVFSPIYEVAQMTRISDPALQSEVRLFSAVFKHGSLTVTRRLRRERVHQACVHLVAMLGFNRQAVRFL